MTVQPSEVAKVLLLVFFASYLVAKRTCCRWPAAACSESTSPRP